MALLQKDEGSSVVIVNPQGRSAHVLVCEHASNVIPRALGSLGLSPEQLQTHIAWDIGAEAVSRHLSQALDAPLVLQRFSRLVYDCNRPPEAPSAMPEVSENTCVPGNQNLTAAARLERVQEIYRPFHAALSGLLDARACAGRDARLVTLHSFTPVYKGITRDVELGLLFDRDNSMAEGLLPHFRDVVARFNAPYAAADGVLHTLDMHAHARGLASVMLEIRNDLIVNEAGQVRWATRLAQALEQLT